MKPFLVLGIAVVMGINADPGTAEGRRKALAQGGYHGRALHGVSARARVRGLRLLDMLGPLEARQQRAVFQPLMKRINRQRRGDEPTPRHHRLFLPEDLDARFNGRSAVGSYLVRGKPFVHLRENECPLLASDGNGGKPSLVRVSLVNGKPRGATIRAMLVSETPKLVECCLKTASVEATVHDFTDRGLVAARNGVLD